MTKARVALAEDHAMIVEAFKRLLEPKFDVVGTASDGRQLLELALATRPDVVLLDLAMLSLSGFDDGQQLKTRLPGTKLIVITMSNDCDIAGSALREWASGYILKTSSGEELRNALDAVIAGSSM